MAWEPDAAATRRVRRVFDDCEPTVRRNGGHYLVTDTPYGTLELIAMGGKYLVAAKSPPPDATTFDPACLPPELGRHLERNHLVPWKVVPGADLVDALRHLADDQTPPQPSPPGLAAYLCPLPEPREVIGENRQRAAYVLGSMMAAQRPGDPVPLLAGPRGVGKRTVAVAACERLGLRPVGLPIGRLLIERVFSTPEETLLTVLLVAAAELTDQTDVLVLSDAEWLGRLPGPIRRHMLSEMSRLPHAVLLSDDRTVARIGDVVAVACPGLSHPPEVQRLVGMTHPQVRLVDPVLKMICRAAHVPGVGVVPGRALYMVRLGLAMLPAAGRRPVTFSPDEVATAIRMAREAWARPGPESFATGLDT